MTKEEEQGGHLFLTGHGEILVVRDQIASILGASEWGRWPHLCSWMAVPSLLTFLLPTMEAGCCSSPDIIFLRSHTGKSQGAANFPSAT